MMALRLMKGFAGLSFILMFSAFWAVSEGVSCVGYCYGDDQFNIHYQEDSK